MPSKSGDDLHRRTLSLPADTASEFCLLLLRTCAGRCDAHLAIEQDGTFTLVLCADHSADLDAIALKLDELLADEATRRRLERKFDQQAARLIDSIVARSVGG